MNTDRAMENVCLSHDNGEDIKFRGRLFSECSWFDEENGILTKQKLYMAENNEQVYYIASGKGSNRNKRAYRISVMGDHCIIHNGAQEIVLQFDMLMLAVRSLCGLEDDATPTLASIEETLKAANA